jgi:hypothetical protein
MCRIISLGCQMLPRWSGNEWEKRVLVAEAILTVSLIFFALTCIAIDPNYCLKSWPSSHNVVYWSLFSPLLFLFLSSCSFKILMYKGPI